ncbi:MAG: hypothetical protein ACXVRK_10105 [Gaiellaceae bacterium]
MNAVARHELVHDNGRRVFVYGRRELWDDERHELVLIFENRGAEAGAGRGVSGQMEARS